MAVRKKQRPCSPPKVKKTKKKSSSDAATRRGGLLGKFALWTLLWLVIATGVGFGMLAVERQVLAHRAQVNSIRYTIDLQTIPGWMPKTLQQEIRRELTHCQLSYTDANLCEEIFSRAEANPWVSKVHFAKKQRVNDPYYPGRVCLCVEFRKPLAKVYYDHGNARCLDYYVAEDGVVLPNKGIPRWQGRVGGVLQNVVSPDQGIKESNLIHYIRITGVTTPPPKVGQVWNAPDLAAGIKLVKWAQTRTYSAEVATVDVANYNKRYTNTEPELRMLAQVGRSRLTEIRFGRFPREAGPDYVISPSDKFKALDKIVADHRDRLAGIRNYIDLRYDHARFSQQ